MEKSESHTGKSARFDASLCTKQRVFLGRNKEVTGGGILCPDNCLRNLQHELAGNLSDQSRLQHLTVLTQVSGTYGDIHTGEEDRIASLPVALAVEHQGPR